MSSKQQVKEFHIKIKMWDILFLDERDKNSQTLSDLELMPNERKKIIEKLEIDDYCEGPLEETQYGGSEMWVFGRMLRRKEIYIKITLGALNTSVICISFHIAEYKMNYQFK
jgi:hypothetical protein